MTVRSVAARQYYRTDYVGAHARVRSRPRTQFLLVDLGGDPTPDRSTAREELAVVADERYRPVDAEDRIDPRFGQFGSPPVVAVAVDRPLRAEAARIVWGDPDRAAWRVPDRTVERLRAPPSFELRSFSVPDRGPPGETVTATVTVANVGGSRGRFLGELGTERLSELPEFSLSIPAGATATHEGSVFVPPGSDPTDELTVVLRTPVGSRRATVRPGE